MGLLRDLAAMERHAGSLRALDAIHAAVAHQLAQSDATGPPPQTGPTRSRLRPAA